MTDEAPSRQAPFRFVLSEGEDGWNVIAETTTAEHSLLFESKNRMSYGMADQVVQLLLSIRDPSVQVAILERPRSSAS